MLLDENYDADEILKEPDEKFYFEFDKDDENTPELSFGDDKSYGDMDIPPEEEEDLYS